MQGSVLSAGSDRNLILGDDGVRYAFVADEWQGGDVMQEAGVRVDFAARGLKRWISNPIPTVLSSSPPPPPPILVTL